MRPGAWIAGKLTPPSLAQVEAETRKWRITCRRCGRSDDLWEAGGVRHGGGGRARTVLGRCAGCGGRMRTMRVHRAGE